MDCFRESAIKCSFIYIAILILAQMGQKQVRIMVFNALSI